MAIRVLMSATMAEMRLCAKQKGSLKRGPEPFHSFGVVRRLSLVSFRTDSGTESQLPDFTWTFAPIGHVVKKLSPKSASGGLSLTQHAPLKKQLEDAFIDLQDVLPRLLTFSEVRQMHQVGQRLPAVAIEHCADWTSTSLADTGLSHCADCQR